MDCIEQTLREFDICWKISTVWFVENRENLILSEYIDCIVCREQREFNVCRRISTVSFVERESDICPRISTVWFVENGENLILSEYIDCLVCREQREFDID